MNELHEVEGKVKSYGHEGARAVVDVWQNYNISLADFSSVIIGRGLAWARAAGARAWVVDSSRAKGCFSPEVQEFIGRTAFPQFAAAGIRHFITVRSQSAITNMTIKSYSEKAGPAGITLVEVNSFDEAVAYLEAARKVA
jgi:hypothetical protein